jgi:hypothetical protein
MPIPLRSDFAGAALRQIAHRTKNRPQARNQLAWSADACQ